MSTEVVDAQVVVEPGTELAPVDKAQAPALFGTSDPVEVIERASAIATALDGVIQGKGMFHRIGSKQHVTIDGWQTLGAMLGITATIVWTREIGEGDWEARAEAVTADGRLVGSAEAMCCSAEGGMWAGPKAINARRAMAQTRAMSRAYRGPLGFVVNLAGYSATGFEEMPAAHPEPASPVIDAARADAIAELIGQVLAVDPDAVGRIWAAAECPHGTVNREAVSHLTVAQADRLQPLLAQEASK